MVFGFFGHEVCGILVLWPRIKPVPPALEGEVLNAGPFSSLRHPCEFPIGATLPRGCLSHVHLQSGSWHPRISRVFSGGDSPSLFFPDPHLIQKFLDISSIKTYLFRVPFPWVLARKGKVIVHFFLLLSNVLTYYWWSLETGDYGTDFRHQAGSMVGMFLRVGESVNGYQTHSEWDIIHPGLSTNEAIPAPTQNWARGCVPAPVSAPLLSPGPHVPEWGRPCCFWLRAKDIPGRHPPPMTLQGWSINTSAPSALG